jgi:hypothetical protein
LLVEGYILSSVKFFQNAIDNTHPFRPSR